MKKALALAFCAVLVGAVSAQETRILRFGLISDTHVCDKGDQSPAIAVNASPRYFTGGLAKLEAFAKDMNAAGAAFVAELGDFTDNPADASLSPEKRKAAALGFVEAAETKLALFKGPRYHVFGNHDTDQLSKQDFAGKTQNTGIVLPEGQFHYSFDKGGVHFVALDSSYKADGASYSGIPGSPGAGYSWADANVPKAEVEWLKADLAATKLPTVVLAHQLLGPLEQVDSLFDPAHSVKNAAEVRSVLEKSGKVIAVFAGHYHDGGYQSVNGIHYLTLQASAAYGNDASYHNQYATVDIFAEGKNYRLAVTGHGIQKSYVLAAAIK